MAKRPASASPGVAEAIAYAEGVVAGRTPAGRLARLACVRFLRDKAAADAGTGPWGFNPALVEAALLFAGQMPNIKGPEAGHPLRLMPWQKEAQDLVAKHMEDFFFGEGAALPPGYMPQQAK